MKELRRQCEEKYHIELRHIRVFTQEGVELFSEDLQYLRDNSKLYITKGEDFDGNIIYQEYEILQQLGEGGFGKVLLGRHKETLNCVAIKYMSARNRDADDVDLVFREGQLLKSLNHKNIVKVYNCYPLKDMQVILVMEYLEGGDMYKYTKSKGPLSEEETRMYFKQICDAIAYCHNRKLIHRDLKLENIMFAKKNESLIKIVDFGIAGVDITSNMDKTNIGTFYYMAPEILNGKIQRIGPNIDVWALGVILYQLVFGQYPFDGDSNQQILKNILSANYQFPKKIVSPYLIDLLSRIFMADPNKRIKLYDIMNHEWMNNIQSEIEIPIPSIPRTQFRLPKIDEKPKPKKLNRSFTPIKNKSPAKRASFLIKIKRN